MFDLDLGGGGGSLPKPMERNLYLFEEVDLPVMQTLTDHIVKINENDQHLKLFYSLHSLDYSPDPIRLHIDSPGGHIYAALGFASFLMASETPIETIVYGHAMSAAFLIAVCGTTRSCYKHSTFMYHQLSVSGLDEGKLKDLIDEAEEVKRLQIVYDKIITQRTKITPQQMEKAFVGKSDWNLPPTDALKLGVVDKIL